MNPFDSVTQQAIPAWKQLVEAGFDVAAKALQEQRAYVLLVTDILTQSTPAKG